MPHKLTSRPYIDIEKTTIVYEKGEGIPIKSPNRIFLDTCWGTMDHILRQATKPGNKVIGYGNFVMKGNDGEPTIPDELMKIKAFADAVISGSNPEAAAEQLSKAVEEATAPLLKKLAEYEKKHGKKNLEAEPEAAEMPELAAKKAK